MTTNVQTDQNTNLIGVNLMEQHNAPNSASNRFTKEEKQILFELFIDNEDIIDIKQRKTSSKKHISIRDCWNKITDEYNSHPNITTPRSLKQIQKFWLNARLRKSYPANTEGNINTTGSVHSESIRRPSTTESNSSANIKSTIVHTTSNLTNSSTSTVTPPKLIRITSQHQKPSESRIYENIKFEKDCETEEIEMVATEEEEDLTQEVEISTSSNDVNMVESESQQYSIDHISAEKLTLNDLLEFKNGRSRDEIVLQIRTSDPIPTGTTITNQGKDPNTQYTTSYRITHPVTQNTIIQEHQFQQIQPHQSQPQHINVTSQPVPQKLIQSPQTLNSPNFYTTNNQSNNFRTYESVEDKINYYQLKEAELKFKAEQLKIEKMKIELQKSKDELKNVRELHAFRIKEMEMKLKLLSEEEKRLKPTLRKIN